jgi:hypothetical protein
LFDPGVGVAQRNHEADQLALLAGLQPSPGKGLNPTPAPDLPAPLHGAGGGGIALGAPSAPTVTTSPVVSFADHSIVLPGSSTLMRTDNAVTIHLHTSGLQPGAYTFWWAVFNPGQTVPVVGRAAGHVVGQSGIANVSAYLRVGETVGDPPLAGFEGTLQDARHAVIALVVRYHGPVDPGHVWEQTHTYQPELGFGPPADARITIHPPPT